MHRSIVLAIAAASAPLAAQTGTCAAGPGGMFGIVAFQCANCGWKYEVGGKASHTFFTEPVVTETAAGSAVENGDVIVAVDGNPITTRAGADRFEYPGSGQHVLTVRRGREPREINIDAGTKCAITSTVGGTAAGSRVGREISGTVTNVGDGRVRISGRGTNTVVAGGVAGPKIYIDGVLVSSDTARLGKFGFAVVCKPSCSAQFQANGDGLYKYDGYPPIDAIRPGSAADKAGLRRGDLILRVNGKSILDETGILQRAEQQDQLRLTVQRDGKEIDVVMVVTR